MRGTDTGRRLAATTGPDEPSPSTLRHVGLPGAGRGVGGRWVLALAWLAGSLVPAPAWAGAPTEAVRTTINQVIEVLTDPKYKEGSRAEERRQTLLRVIGTRFHYAEMAKRSLGRNWKDLNVQQQKEFVGLFEQLLSATYASKIEGYSGEQVHYLNERLEGEFAEVRTKVVSGKTEIPLYYRLLKNGSDWQVYDVVVDGVSLVKNYRGQFAQILRDFSHAELVDKLKKKIDELKSK